MASPHEDSDDLVSVPVHRRHYALIIQTLANALAGESARTNPLTPVAAGDPMWTIDEIRLLRRQVDNKTVQTMMEMVCASPGKKVTFPDVYKRAGRTSPQARADLAGFTKLIRQRFNRNKWPINVVQNPDGGLTYDVGPTIADAWKSAS
jgi:hypothetical protein